MDAPDHLAPLDDTDGAVEIVLAGRSFPITRPRVLDIGGGSGAGTVDLARRGATVTVVDSSVDALAMLERRAVEAGVRDRVSGVQGDAEHLARSVPSASFDVVLLHRLLDEVDDPAAVVQQAVAAAVPGGLVSITVPSRYSLVLNHFRHGRFRSVVQDLPDSADPAGTVCWSAGELEALLAAAGLEVLTVVGLGRWTAAENEGAAELPEPVLAQEVQQRLAADPVLRELCPQLQVVGVVPGGASGPVA